MSSFRATFRENWASFYSNIWSHCCHNKHLLSLYFFSFSICFSFPIFSIQMRRRGVLVRVLAHDDDDDSELQLTDWNATLASFSAVTCAVKITHQMRQWRVMLKLDQSGNCITNLTYVSYTLN